MTIEDPRLVRAARAMVESDLLIGVDAVPVRSVTLVGDAHPSAPSPPAGSSASVESKDFREAVVDSGDLELALDPGALDGEDAAARLGDLESRHAASCRQCTQSTSHRSIVFGEGDPQARIMLVGEAPGAEEDRTGRPFVGKAGELLDRMIAAVGLERKDVYIANVLKTRPPENRTPRPDEVAHCGPWLASQIAVVQPSVIVALGGTPAKHLLGTSTGITRLRGIRAEIVVAGRAVAVLPTFHPAYVLRQYTEEVRRAVWEDLKQAVAIVDGL